MDLKLKIFCDFDGTITQNDVWIATVSSFIEKNDKWNEIFIKFQKGEIGTREFIVYESTMVKDFDFDKFNEIIDKQEVDPYFQDFVNYCKINKIPIAILSEGMDYYIKRIFDKHKIDLTYYSNKLVITDNNKRIDPEFPYSDSDCFECGCCKRNLLLNMTGDDEISVYIGDEFSDRCAVQYADMVFAKKSLASYCWKNNITYFEYRNFQDIKYKLEKIIARKNIKHRQTAKFRRREVYLRG
jgi:2-hydroxy-3-keto-5-methylthiopentenyl-1-phosphate phosphatase